MQKRLSKLTTRLGSQHQHDLLCLLSTLHGELKAIARLPEEPFGQNLAKALRQRLSINLDNLVSRLQPRLLGRRSRGNRRDLRRIRILPIHVKASRPKLAGFDVAVLLEPALAEFDGCDPSRASSHAGYELSLPIDHWTAINQMAFWIGPGRRILSVADEGDFEISAVALYLDANALAALAKRL